MNRHWKGLLVLLLLGTFGFAIAMSTHQPWWALFGIIGVLVIGFVLCIDWMRPSGTPRS